MSKFSAYAVTIRPKDGITDQDINKVSTWIRKKCDYYHVVTEKTGSERHLHAGFFLKTPVVRSNMVTVFKRMFAHLTSTELSVLLKGIKVMYNYDFIDNYLDKDDDTMIIISSPPEQAYIDSYVWPSIAERSAKKISPYYHELEDLWYQHSRPGVEVNPINCRHFLVDMMYNKRIISVIRDDKQIVQVSRHLSRWITKASEWDGTDIPIFEKDW